VGETVRERHPKQDIAFQKKQDMLRAKTCPVSTEQFLPTKVPPRFAKDMVHPKQDMLRDHVLFPCPVLAGCAREGNGTWGACPVCMARFPEKTGHAKNSTFKTSPVAGKNLQVG
jgi:hypothetical protein